MSQPDWNARFAETEFAYGAEPNSFLVQNASWLKAPVLSIAEGEGRNAVFLAAQGLNVHAVDSSHVGLAKAERLAASKSVIISTEVVDLQDFAPEPNAYGGAVSIYAHLPSPLRTRLYPLLVKTLKPGGVLILESYAENQIGRGTGGPSNLDLLMTCDKVERELVGLETILLQETEREVIEGKFHTGLASVIQYVGKKPI
ncbi:class I SAM-dependent methyltransferase [Mariniblastus fucicola]|uniref:Tellurite resistance protein TehB n=1 Tax=Mariniblastus fucicola TaxID=980251 RepID=A0A5B9PHL4_9BACT|nr:class I SAM-dependent methyltransferase [Mariniblastus fucicola]QEG24790.1 tellurite resistance protein TehB [Mariniblastus fucicola]